MRTRFLLIPLLVLAILLAACRSTAPTDEPYPAPAADPTTAPADEAYPAPAMDPNPAPVVEPYPEPTIEPTLPPTPEPSPEPTLAPTADFNAPSIQPGDQLDGFTITTAGEGEVTFGWDGNCPEQPRAPGDTLIRYECALTTAQKFNPCSAAYTFGSGRTLDEIWAEFKYELKINGRPVDLEAFGTFDFIHPQFGPMRIYNVAIVASQPGEITIEDVTTMPGQPAIPTTAHLVFTAP